MLKLTKTVFALAAVAAVTLAAARSEAAVIRLGQGAFTPEATTITFSEQPQGTVNPVYALTTANLGGVTVSFGGHFVGQAASVGFPVSLSDTTPTGPLALDPLAPATFIVGDGANPTSPVLSGTPTFNGPIAVLFSTAVAAVGLDGGFFNAIGGTSIEAFAADGSSLGIVTNTQLGIEFFGLADSTGANVIKGISFYITGNEPAGFGIDNLTFGSVDEIVDPPVGGAVPEPGTLALLTLGGLGFVGRAVRRRKAAV